MPGNVTRLQIGTTEIILIGTAHVSADSVQEVEQTIREELPDNVCIEIDRSRYTTLTEGTNWSSLDLSQVLKQGKGLLLLVNLVLASFQKRLGLELGIRPGEEMIKAIETAKELNIPFTLSDREIQITLQRAWGKTGLWEKNKMIAAIAGSVLFQEKFSQEEIEKLKEKNEMENMLGEISTYLPSVKSVLIDERDRYLATSIFTAAGNKKLAVVGAGHVPGIIRTLHQLQEKTLSSDLTELNVLPVKKKLGKFLPWIFSGALIVLLVLGFFLGGFDKGLNMFFTWWIVNGTMSALGSLAVLAHPLTIILAFLAAPLATLNPFIAIGMITGISEYKLKKPKARDFEGLSTEIGSLKGFFKNRITHILLVFLTSTLGSMLGTFIAFPVIAALLAGK